MKMNTSIKKKWIAALRSGKYVQGTGELKTDEGEFCCLGVLTDLYCKTKRVGWDKATESQNSILPVRVMQWAGLKDRNPEVGKGQHPLSEHNDGDSYLSVRKKSFKQIANLIKNNL